MSIAIERRRALAQKSETVAMLARVAQRKAEYGDHYDLAELVAALLAGGDANVLLGLKHARAGSPTDNIEERRRVKAMFLMAVLTRAGMTPGRAAKKVAADLKSFAPELKDVSDKTILAHWKGKGKELKHADFLVPYRGSNGETQRVTRWRARGEAYADAQEDFRKLPPG